LLPYRFGIINASQFTAQLNSGSQVYYTNPCICLSNKELDERAWTNFNVVRLPYQRGFMYLVTLDAEKRHPSNGSRSFDEVILELLVRQDAGEPFGVDTFLSLVSASTGPQAVAEFREMASGKRLQIPAPHCMSSAGLTLRHIDMPPFELRFTQIQGNITEVVQGYRAAEAGLRIGDRIVVVSELNRVADGLELNVTVRVRHLEEDMKEITYWPRARYTVEGYQ
jgi:predicted metalloprotease with PDZ domain